MPAKLEEVTLRYEHEVVRFSEETAIIECSEVNTKKSLLANTVRVIVDAKEDELVTGLDYRFYGRWSNHPRYGKQLKSKTFLKTQPHDQRGVIRYLQLAPNIGPAYARQLWDKFEGHAVRIVREDPEMAAAATGLTEEHAKEASEHFRFEAHLEGATIDLMALLDGRGFPKATTKKAIKEFGNLAAELIKKNPYLLMQFRGCGFLLCDKLYMELGHDPKKLKRQALCAWYVIARNTEGHTWHGPGLIERGLRERIASAGVREVDAVRLAIRGGLLASHRDDKGGVWLADSKKAAQEARVADRTSEWLREESTWPSLESLDVSDHQREMLSEALRSQIAIFTGGPGTGKTYSAARLIAELMRLYGGRHIAVCAPTGKAAVRITDALNEYGVKLRAKTIHSTLEVKRSDSDGWTFEHNERNPLPYRYVIVDEASMLDTSLASSLFRACGRGTHLLLVGDTGQLPPVGHGAPLRDLIAAGVPCGELTEIRRNSGMIVEACHQMRKGERFKTTEKLNPNEGRNLKVLPAVKPDNAIKRIVDTIRAIGKAQIADPIWGCQVIVAVNEKSQLSRKTINKKLQLELNPGGKVAGVNPFRVADKIVCTENGFVHACSEKDKNLPEVVREWLVRYEGVNDTANERKVFVANGEQANVIEVEPMSTYAFLESPYRVVRIFRGAGGAGPDDGKANCSWDLAYAISCHKSQGSEWPVGFVVLDEYPGARMVCSREWLYTAASRAKVACFMVGKAATGYGMLGRQAIALRKTFLSELIELPPIELPPKGGVSLDGQDGSEEEVEEFLERGEELISLCEDLVADMMETVEEMGIVTDAQWTALENMENGVGRWFH